MKFRSIFWFSILVGNSLFSQSRDLKERVFLHPNSQTFIVGETLKFSAYTLSNKTDKLIDLSKIMYIELVGKNGAVFQQKIALKKGQGSGYFFINSLIPTGKYQLLAYTRWMRNFEDLFQLSITIINPFEADFEMPAPSALSMKFYCENDSMLVAGLTNKIGFRILNRSEGSDYKGKVLSNTGEVAASFMAANKGTGSFSFIPEQGKSYRVALEDNTGKFSFHELMPIRDSGYRIEYEYDELYLRVTPRIANKSTSYLQLQIHFADEFWSKISVAPNKAFTIPIASLPPSTFQLSLVDNGRIFSSIPVRLPRSEEVKPFSIPGLKKSYNQRETLRFEVKIPRGNYSLSIHQKNDIGSNSKIESIDSRFWSILKDPLADNALNPIQEEDEQLTLMINDFKPPADSRDSVSFLPENRGELLSGTIKNNEGSEIADLEMALAFAGEKSQTKTAFTDEKGRFLFQFHPSETDQDIYLKPLNGGENFQLEIEDKFLSEYPAFDYQMPQINADMLAQIRDRSINSQITNAFFKRDTLANKNLTSPDEQFLQYDHEYNLDDYKRFPDLREYFVEYILNVGIRKDEIIVLPKYYLPDFKREQLILLDGIPVSSKKILEIDPYLVKKIKVIANRFYLGPSLFDGVVLLETYEGDLANYKPEAVLMIPYLGLKYTTPQITSNLTNNQLEPDRRVDLYWDPQINWESDEELSIEAKTSDVKGNFEMRIEGFSQQGRPISITKSFEVK